MKKVPICAIITVLAFICATNAAYAVEKSPVSAKNKPAAADSKMTTAQKDARSNGAMKPNFNMILGSVSKIDNADPKNVKIEVMDSRDNQMHIIEMTPTTNVTKVTKISELKAGDSVRIMARRIENKEVAMGIIFGDFETMRRPPMPVNAQANLSKKITPPVQNTANKKK